VLPILISKKTRLRAADVLELLILRWWNNVSPRPLEAILEDCYCYVGEVKRDKGLAVEVNWELCMGKLGEAKVQMLSPKELEGSIQQPSHAAR
jgi:hypothetical protein